jgi:hypothetical protein
VNRDRFEASMRIAEFWFRHYERRAREETQYRTVFWGAIVALMFVPKLTPTVDWWKGLIVALGLFVAYIYWMFGIYRANQRDQENYRHWLRVAEKIFEEDSASTRNKESGREFSSVRHKGEEGWKSLGRDLRSIVFGNWSFRAQIVNTLTLLAICFFALLARGILK